MWSMEPPKKPTQEQLEASEAVRQLGTNAVPELLEMLETKEGFSVSMKERVRAWLTQHGFMKPSYSYETHTPASEMRHRAALGLIALEPSAKPKVRELLWLLSVAECCKETALVPASLGPEGLEPLQAVIKPITNNAPPGIGVTWQSVCAIWALGHFPTNAKPIVPEILAGLTDSSYECAWALTRIQTEPEVAIPALTNAASQQELRPYCLRALANYGERAKTAVPFLLDLFHEHRSREVAEALRAIDPEAAAKAGVR